MPLLVLWFLLALALTLALAVSSAVKVALALTLALAVPLALALVLAWALDCSCSLLKLGEVVEHEVVKRGVAVLVDVVALAGRHQREVVVAVDVLVGAGLPCGGIGVVFGVGVGGGVWCGSGAAVALRALWLPEALSLALASALAWALSRASGCSGCRGWCACWGCAPWRWRGRRLWRWRRRVASCRRGRGVAGRLASRGAVVGVGVGVAGGTGDGDRAGAGAWGEETRRATGKREDRGARPPGHATHGKGTKKGRAEGGKERPQQRRAVEAFGRRGACAPGCVPRARAALAGVGMMVAAPATLALLAASLVSGEWCRR